MGKYLDKVADPNSLYDAFKKCRIGTVWKESVQRFGHDLLRNIRELSEELRSGSYEQKPFVEFDLCERGKARHIKSMHIRDRVVQRSICDNALCPEIVPRLIYDNGASIEGKGVSFARNRLQCHLERYVRTHGTDGYVLKGDFAKFFDNIDHRIMLEALEKRFGSDPEFMELMRKLIRSFRVDVSKLSDEEIEAFGSKPIDLLSLPRPSEGIEFLDRSVGIGSQVSQIIGVMFPSPIDHLVKTKLGCRFYGRYMDDFYILHPSREFLEDVLNKIRIESEKLKMFMNERKTKIFPIRNSLTFMKIRYRITETGQIAKTLSGESIARERRRIKSQIGVGLDPKHILDSYKSWRGNAIKFDSGRTVHEMDKLIRRELKK